MTIWTLLRGTFIKSVEDRVPKLAAALSYYMVFSLVPLLVIAVAIAARLYGPAAARGEVAKELASLVGTTTAQTIQSTIRSAVAQRSGFIATMIGTAVMLYGASVVFYDLQESLDLIWKVSPRRRRGRFWRAPRNWLISVAVALGMGLMLILCLPLSNLVAAADSRVSDGLWLGRSMVARGISFGLAALLFSAVFKFLPDTRVPWKSVCIGALTTAVLFTAGKSVLTIYLRHTTATSPYGAAGSLAAMLLWFYYSAQILYFGAELSQVHANAGKR
ncbi:MAG TPA: YihY/virulence factor BrkB family protein [Humisphaera sp.]|jgi:membrane protein|nr:YihY/virulence factor BrkB family protein [Humisphaera sp.]